MIGNRNGLSAKPTLAAGLPDGLTNSAMSLIGKGGSLLSNTATLLVIAYWRRAEDAGAYSLATKYAALFLGFALLGLDHLLIRDVAQNPKQARNYVAHFSLLRLLTGAIALGCLSLFVSQFPGYSPHTVGTVILFALGLIPESLYRLYQSAFVSLDAYAPLAYTGIIKAVLGMSLGIGALWVGASLQTAVLLQVGGIWLTLLITYISLRTQLKLADMRHGCGDVERFSLSQAKKWLRATLSLAVIDGLYTLEWQLDIVVLSFFVDEAQVGFYGVAQGGLSILMLLLYSVDTVAYPLISRVVLQGQSRVRRTLGRLTMAIAASTIPLGFMLALSLRLVVPSFDNGRFVPLLSPLYWLIGAWVIHFLCVPAVRLIISVGKQGYVAAFVAFGVTLGTILNLLLIPSLGILAPATSRAISAAAYALLCASAALWLLARIREPVKNL